jgi:hypothetical protein
MTVSSLLQTKLLHLAADLRYILQRGGFRLTKWVSNSPKVVGSIPEPERAGSVKDVCPGQPTLERALGVQWNVGLDQFGFKIKMKGKLSTRRGVLSLVSSVYDPLGFAALFVLVAKMLMQELCRKNLSWNDPIQGEYLDCLRHNHSTWKVMPLTVFGITIQLWWLCRKIGKRN